MNTRQAKLLLRLAKFLRERVPRRSFDLRYFLHEVPKINPSKALKDNSECGATACAVGWLPVALPAHFEFRVREGAVLVVDKARPRRMFQEAVCSVFGLSISIQEYLFFPKAYHPQKRGPAAVAQRLERFVAKGMPAYYRYYEGSRDYTYYYVPGYGMTSEPTLISLKASGGIVVYHNETQNQIGFPWAAPRSKKKRGKEKEA